MSALDSGPLPEPSLEEEIRLAVPDETTLQRILEAWSPQSVDRSYRDCYLDHPAFGLLKQRLAVRLRSLSGARRIEIKGGGVQRAGVWQRPEWSQEWPEAWSRIPEELPPGPVRRCLLAHLPADQPLIELFTCEVTRRSAPITLDDGGSVMLCIDQGEIRAGEKRVRIREVELEWLSGSRDLWQAWMRALRERYGLVPAAASKFAVGLAMLPLPEAWRHGFEY
ncbi:MAG: CYTH domain-containing protein [Magnetococcales bacterium]|nr:CYTH domain-containing protein [Magnetococcales bacterium]